jgi:sulfate adenylyltransferase subunit 2
VVRETVAAFARPTLMFSGGKDSAVLLDLAVRALAPMPLPFPLLHVDTGHNFPEVLRFRDERAAACGARLVVAAVEDGARQGLFPESALHEDSRNRLQTPVLLRAIRDHGFDALLGGARRDEEKARAKERVFSVRNSFGQWEPRAQRPELWDTPNTRLAPGQHMRVFPLSNWTEVDVWRYIRHRRIALPGLYFAHQRAVFPRAGMLLPDMPGLRRDGDPAPAVRTVRYRTVGDMTCTGAVESAAVTVDDVMAEISHARVTERGATRADDRTSAAAMEDRKREGYF